MKDLEDLTSAIDGDPNRPWGINLDDIDSIAARRRADVIELSTCADCDKKIFRVPDYTGRTLVWNHSSTGNPVSYSPDTHDARLAVDVEPHTHEWIEEEWYLICSELYCGARKVAESAIPAIEPGVFIKRDDREAESRRRGAHRGAAALKESRARKAAQSQIEPE